MFQEPVETPHQGYERLGIRSHGKGTFHSNVAPGKELETAKMFRVRKDKFIVNITFGWEQAIAITTDKDEGKLVSHRFPQFSIDKSVIPSFLKYLILDPRFKNHLELSSPGGAGRNRVLKISEMLDFQCSTPSINEQLLIAQLFENFSHLITLHQHQLNFFKGIDNSQKFTHL